MAAIDPSQIPGEDPKLDPDAVEDAARALRADAEAIRETGGEVVDAWSRLRDDYQAPESEQLLRSMDPVRTETATVGGDLGRAAAALMTFAGELREIKVQFDRVRADAFAFKERIRSNPEWEFDQALIDENGALLGRVNSTQVQLWDAERECANAIRAIDDIKRWHSGFAEGDQYGYGLSSIPAGTEMPWGAPVDKQEHCPMSAAIAVKSAVWDGFGHDVIVEGFKGLGGLIGLGDDGFTMETFESTWGGMGALIGRDAATGDWAWGTAGDAWLQTGKSLVAWDMWAEDPARATGTTLGNIALTVATLGTGAAVKGVASAGRTGQVLSVAGQALRVVGKAMDPVELLVGGAKVLKGVRLVDTFEAARFHSILNTDEILKGLEFDPDVDMTMPEPDGLDAPLAENSASNSTREGVREPALVGAVTRNADDVGQAGSHVSVDQPSTGSGSGSDSGGSGHSALPEDSSLRGGGDDRLPDAGPDHGVRDSGGPEPDNSAPAISNPVGAGVDDVNPASLHSQPNMVERSTGQVAARDVLGGLLERHSLTETEFRDLVSSNVADLSPAEARALKDIRDSLPAVADGDVLQKVVTHDDVRRFFVDMGAEDAWREMVRRDETSVSRSHTGKHGLDSVGGFVSRLADVVGWRPPEIYDRLGLDYETSRFKPDEQSYWAVRYRAGDVDGPAPAVPHDMLDIVSGLPEGYSRADLERAVAERVTDLESQHKNDAAHDLAEQARQALDPANPFRGNGFAGSGGNYSPELEYVARVDIPDGAEMWRIRPDGSEELVARYDNGWDPLQESGDIGESAPDPSPEGGLSTGPADQTGSPDASADEGPNSGHDSDPGAERHTGGHVGPKDVFRREMWSEEAYEAIRGSTDDVGAIAADLQNRELPDGTTLTPDDVAAIKDHVFLREHEIEYGDGEIIVKQFDSSAEQAEAWYRLQDGLGTETDRLWLLHEKTELEYLQAHPGSKYREAHAAANEVANWAKEVGLD